MEEQKTFSPEDFENMKTTFGRKTPLWVEAFKVYNSNKANRQLSMSCRPCYAKVLHYLQKI